MQIDAPKKRTAAQRHFSVSFLGDDTWRMALYAYAQERGETVGTVLRNAVEKQIGDELQPYLSFFASRGDRNHQSVIVNPSKKTVKSKKAAQS